MINEGVKYYCKDDISLIENHDKAINDSNQMWHCHHRREIETPRKELIKIGEYYNRPASELIFLTQKEHNSLHNTLKFKGKTLSYETKRKLSAANKGKIFTEEHKQKLSEAMKGKPSYWKGIHLYEETKRKIAAAKQGRHWWNNGINAVCTEECPEGFVKGRLKKAI